MMLWTLKFTSFFGTDPYKKLFSELSPLEIKGALEFYAIARNDMPLWKRVQALTPIGPAWSVFPISAPPPIIVQIERCLGKKSDFLPDASPNTPYPETILTLYNLPIQNMFKHSYYPYIVYVMRIMVFNDEVYVLASIKGWVYAKKVEEKDKYLYQEIIDQQEPIDKQNLPDISIPTVTSIINHLKMIHDSIQDGAKPDASFCADLSSPWEASHLDLTPKERSSFYPSVITTEMFFTQSALLNRTHFLNTYESIPEGFEPFHYAREALSLRHVYQRLPFQGVLRKEENMPQEYREEIKKIQNSITQLSVPHRYEQEYVTRLPQKSVKFFTTKPGGPPWKRKYSTPYLYSRKPPWELKKSSSQQPLECYTTTPPDCPSPKRRKLHG